jgi:hypothetical protein
VNADEGGGCLSFLAVLVLYFAGCVLMGVIIGAVAIGVAWLAGWW